MYISLPSPYIMRVFFLGGAVGVMCSAFAPAPPAAGGCALMPGVRPDAGGAPWCRKGAASLLGGVASLARRMGCGSAAPLGGDFLRYIGDFLRYIFSLIFWIIADNLLPLGKI